MVTICTGTLDGEHCVETSLKSVENCRRSCAQKILLYTVYVQNEQRAIIPTEVMESQNADDMRWDT